uniref:Ig-like domain-containing protein n=1 Tax=Naja naja TaxID=35670 RepID=A0A8C6V976_NAJNA
LGKLGWSPSGLPRGLWLRPLSSALQPLPEATGWDLPSPGLEVSSMDPASPNTILLCTATGFYPLKIEVQWLKNGQLEEEGMAFGEDLQNGDWTYQLQVMLETQTQRGDVYTCQVGHVSLEAPITVQDAKSCPEFSKFWGREGGKGRSTPGLIPPPHIL